MASARVTAHRAREAARGRRRVEIAASSEDAPLLQAAGALLRRGGPEAEALRATLRAATPSEEESLVAFLRASPMVDRDEFLAERAPGPSRPVDLD